MAIAVRGSRWDPFATLVRQLDTDFERLARFDAGNRRAAGAGQGFVPAADVHQDGADLVITLELPGVDPDRDVDVEVAEGRLSIAGSRAERTESESGGTFVREIRAGRFQRTFRLPDGMAPEQVEASYDRGLLQVRVRDVRKPAAGPTKVQVRTAPTPAEVESDSATPAEPTREQATAQATEQATEQGAAQE